MRLLELMNTELFTISANDYAAEALRLMSQRHAEWLIVLDRDQVSGLIWMRDLEQIAEPTLKERDVREFLQTNLLTIHADAQPQEAERLLRRGYASLLVVMRDNKPVGVITQDILRNGLPQKQAS